MDNYIISERIKGYNSEINKNSLNSITEVKKLTLRKRKVEQTILERRKNQAEESTVEKDYKIELENLNLPEEVINKVYHSMDEFFESVKTNLTSKSVELISFGIFSLKQILQRTRKKEFQEVFDRGFIPILLDVLDANLTNKKFIYEIISIFANTICELDQPSLSETLMKPNGYRIYTKIFETNDDVLIQGLLYLFSNAISDTEDKKTKAVDSTIFEVRKNLIHSNLLKDYIIPYLDKLSCLSPYQSPVKDESIERGVNLIQKLSRYEENGNLVLSSLRTNFIRILCINSSTYDTDTYITVLESLAYLTGAYPNLCAESIVKYGVLDSILSCKMINEKGIKLFAGRVLGNYISIDDIDISPELTNKIKDYYKTVLKDSIELCVKIESFWTLSNVVSFSVERVKMMIEDEGLMNILFSTIKSESNYSLLKETFIFCSYLIGFGDLNSFCKFAGFYDYQGIILEKIMKIDCEEPLWLAFNILNKGIYCGEKLSDANNPNFILEDFIKKGGVELLERYQYSQYPRVAQECQEMLKKYIETNNNYVINKL